MSGQLQLVGGDSDPPCGLCGAVAVGPCAHCRTLVCGDCCVLTEGSVSTWAICLRCDKKKGRNLLGGWGLVLLWVGAPILALVLFGLLLGMCRA